jgi:hypothetical protein
MVIEEARKSEGREIRESKEETKRQKVKAVMVGLGEI